MGGVVGGPSTAAVKVPSISVLISVLLAEHPKMADSVTATQPLKAIMSWTKAATLHYLFSRKDAILADVFFHQLATGADLHDGHPVLTLRNKLSAFRNNRQMDMRRGSIDVFVVKTWNAIRQGRELRMLKWLDGEGGIAII